MTDVHLVGSEEFPLDKDLLLWYHGFVVDWSVAVW
mgnify:CR=1 FL=1